MEEYLTTREVGMGIHQKLGSIQKVNAEWLEELNETFCAVAKSNEGHFRLPEVLHALVKSSS
jgi:hypothetical protein